ncbi:hypothetical protein TraAM80_09018 [Trypanosoma rangeli]|uniref:Mucin-associated surface protein (MASP) n=1 Tax=Trypanosoma rangeli TaxID=5698 RepID=A0A3R7M8C6_TRYRA|nr:uncharacterized protein TraAM80_09018 [Trypanosoma rangeli]RNE98014.1 hypothetical protein TraAM80_09018 [Trypanosoma rangeli]|eukprot:RNE98014.1 hypothetical protein TraAM80_09018 [Trypanosoma rangeli]
MSEVEIRAKYCGRKPEFVQLLRASLQAESEQRQAENQAQKNDEKASSATDPKEKVSQVSQQLGQDASTVSTKLETDNLPLNPSGETGGAKTSNPEEVPAASNGKKEANLQSGGSSQSQVEDGATGGAEGTATAPAANATTKTTKATHGDSDGGSAALHCTSPLALLLLFACAVSAAMTAA